MRIDDFCFMWRGRTVRRLEEKEAHLLQPIHIVQRESGRALLLIHGFSSTPAVFRRCVPALLQQYDAIVCPALPGHADSIAAFATSTADDWMDCIEKTALHLKQSYDKLDVLGLSLGGMLAYQLQKKISINHLFLLAPAFVLCGSTGFRLGLAKILHRLGLRCIPNFAGNFHIAGDAELTYKKLPLHAIIEILDWVQHFQYSPTTCPTDVFLGRYDEVVDSQAVLKLMESDARVSLHWMEHSAHILPLDGDVSLILERLKSR